MKHLITKSRDLLTLGHNHMTSNVQTKLTQSLERALMPALFLALLILLTANRPGVAEDNCWKIWDRHSATQWDHGYPVGNGRLGALSYGGFPEERILLNDETVWYLKEIASLPKGAAEALSQCRKLCRQGDYAAADALYEDRLMPGSRPNGFQPVGELRIKHFGIPEQPQAKVLRQLDLRSGLNTTTIDLEDGQIRRFLLASKPHDCVVLRLENTTPAGLAVRLSLWREAGAKVRRDGSDLLLEGQAVVPSQENRASGTRFVGRLRILSSEGSQVRWENDSVTIEGGKQATVLFTSTTDYHYDNPRKPLAEGWQSRSRLILDRASEAGWPQLQQDSSADVASLMERCQIDLGNTDQAVLQLTTAQRLAQAKQGNFDPDLIETLFQFGRYLLVSSSRPGGLPANLQGIWNPHLEAPWKSDFHLNINLQMNYWPAEVTGLNECHQPMLSFVERLLPAGQAMAQQLGYEGFCTGHATDAWLWTTLMSTRAYWGGSVMNGSWCVNHLMMHYRFTQDQSFLEHRAWPVVRENARFILSWLEEDENGLLIAGPGCSPENSFDYRDQAGKTRRAALALGNTFDQMVSWEALSNLLEAARVLGKEDSLTRRASQALERLRPPQIGDDGRLLEWYTPFAEAEPGHRHMSHFYGFFPGNQLNAINHPELTEAIRKSLAHRLSHKGGHTGWSRAWMIGLYARLHDGELALDSVQRLLQDSISPNLFDLHPPFQIDGNFGATAGLAEMLVQSHTTTNDGRTLIQLLPALPPQMPTGSAAGLRARGGFSIKRMEWHDARVTTLVLQSKLPNKKCRVQAGDQTWEVDFSNGLTQTLCP